MDEDKEGVRNMAAAAGQRFFKHLNRLTFLLGMLVGLWIVALGVAFHDLAPTPLRAVKLASPLVDGLLLPLNIFLGGAIMSIIGLPFLVAGYLGALLWAWWYTWRWDRRWRAQP